MKDLFTCTSLNEQAHSCPSHEHLPRGRRKESIGRLLRRFPGKATGSARARWCRRPAAPEAASPAFLTSPGRFEACPSFPPDRRSVRPRERPRFLRCTGVNRESPSQLDHLPTAPMSYRGGERSLRRCLLEGRLSGAGRRRRQWRPERRRRRAAVEARQAGRRIRSGTRQGRAAPICRPTRSAQ
jgi:hypothetical protein